MEIDFTQQIKGEAHRLGFEKVGIAPAEKLEAEALHLKKWIADRVSWHDGMDDSEF